MKKIVYVDMDNVLVDFPSAFDKLDNILKEEFKENMDDIPGIFSLMEPLENAIESYKILNQYFDVYILSTAPWNNPSAWSDKLLWVKKYLGEHAHKRLIISHNKNLNMGDFLIDDRIKNGASDFKGKHILFGQEPFENWEKVVKYLIKSL